MPDLQNPQTDTRHSLHLVDAGDDVGVALRDLAIGERVEGIAIREAVPRGHKLAVRAVSQGSEVRKYGWAIGVAKIDIAPGDHVHSHNLATALSGEEAYVFTAPDSQSSTAAQSGRTFSGYLRANGRVGTRNEIWVICTVGCVARTAQRIAGAAHARHAGRGVDGVYAITHPFGCSQLGDDLGATRQILADLAAHPNAGGVLVVGLGCENNQLDALLAAAPGLDRSRVRSFNAQMSSDEDEDGQRAVDELVAIAAQDVRTKRPLADLVLGLKCGGSDGLSGLTANPLVGRMADAVAEAGGCPILTEIPEIFGAERLLLARAADHDVFNRTVKVVNDFKRYFIDHGQPIYENPSPGNVAGGITTLEEKSLGAVQKSGRSPLRQVLSYGERVSLEPGHRGLALLEAPGNDAVSSTALAAAGATVILFTTGRGTPLGFPTPTLKIATNTPLAQRKAGWIDFDAGRVLSEPRDAVSDALLDLVIDTASGRPTRAEINGEREIAIWKTGVTL
ncbi:MAG TPA: altronate dehydratase family protein [Caulobacteraceae bacterium]|nr:altronate dehydratase family protein [Caulobacteraceae bacterium]